LVFFIIPYNLTKDGKAQLYQKNMKRTTARSLPSKIAAILAAFCFSGSLFAQPIVTQSTSDSTSTTTTNGSTTTKVISAPPSAISPAVTIINSDVCAVGYSGAAQTQILGISFGGAIKDTNCERLKLARSLYDMGMKVAAVSTLCQDERVFTAMMNAGTPCPVDGQIGAGAKDIWENNPDRQPQKIKSRD
jgi:hypothetical protein